MVRWAMHADVLRDIRAGYHSSGNSIFAACCGAGGRVPKAKDDDIPPSVANWVRQLQEMASATTVSRATYEQQRMAAAEVAAENHLLKLLAALAGDAPPEGAPPSLRDALTRAVEAEQRRMSAGPGGEGDRRVALGRVRERVEAEVRTMPRKLRGVRAQDSEMAWTFGEYSDCTLPLWSWDGCALGG